VRRQKGNPINKFRGFNRDVVFLALRVALRAASLTKYIFFLFFINKFRGFKPFWQREKIIFSSFCPLPSALCLYSVKIPLLYRLIEAIIKLLLDKYFLNSLKSHSLELLLL
jgi:hypothetical protein